MTIEEEASINGGVSAGVPSSQVSSGTVKFTPFASPMVADQELSNEVFVGSDPGVYPKYSKPLPVISYLNSTQISAVSGASAGFLAGVAVCPLDVAKTRLQAQGAVLLRKASGVPGPVLKYRGIFDTLGQIFRDEGVAGLYRGLVPITVGYLPTWMIYFTVYEKAKDFYPKMFKNIFNIDMTEESGNPVASYLGYSLSAITAGSVSTIFTNPIWVVKTRLMLQKGDGRTIYETIDKNTKPVDSRFYYSGTLNAFKKMYQNEGLKVFYSGLVPSLFGLLHVAIHFPIYEFLKAQLNCNINNTKNRIEIVSKNNKDAKQERAYYFFKLILASSASKMLASTLTYPHEVLRTRLQIRSTKESTKGTLLSTIKLIYSREGLKGFYSGYTTNLTRTVPSSAVTLVSFEFIKHYLETVNVSEELFT